MADVLAHGVTISGATAILGLIVTALGAVAFVVAYLRASYAKATIVTLKDSNAALTERVEILEGENDRCNVQLQALQTENTNLKTYVSGTEAITQLRSLVTEQFNVVKGMLRDGGPNGTS